MNKTKFKGTEIGRIPEDWVIKKLGEVASFQYGLGESAEKEGELVYIRITDINTDGTLKREGIAYIKKDKVKQNCILKRGDVLVARTGATYGKTYLFNEDFDATYGGFLIKFIFNNKLVDGSFFFQFSKTRTYWNQANNLVGGGAQPQFNANVISELRMPLPSLSEQNKIVNVFSALDKKIELNRQMNSTLETVGQVLFKHWFVDFEFPNEKGKPYKSSGGKMVDSELGAIPEGWRVAQLRDYINIKNGFAFKGEDFIDKGIPVIKIKNVKARKILLTDLSYVSQEVYSENQKYLVNLGDLLITMSGNRIDGSPDTWVGKVALFTRKGIYLLNQRVSIIDIKDEVRNLKYYLSMLLSGYDFQNYFINNATSSGGQANISPDLVKNIRFFIPANNLLDIYSKVYDELFNRISNNAIENENLAKIRDSLLPRLMSGKIRVGVN